MSSTITFEVKIGRHDSVNVSIGATDNVLADKINDFIKSISRGYLEVGKIEIVPENVIEVQKQSVHRIRAIKSRIDELFSNLEQKNMTDVSVKELQQLLVGLHTTVEAASGDHEIALDAIKELTNWP